MVYYELIKITINILGLAEVIINMVMHYYRVPESIITDQGLLLILKFWFLLYYFSKIKKSYL